MSRPVQRAAAPRAPRRLPRQRPRLAGLALLAACGDDTAAAKGKGPAAPAGPPPVVVAQYVGAVGVGFPRETATIGVRFRLRGQGGAPDLVHADRVLRGVVRFVRHNYTSSGAVLVAAQGQAKARVPGLVETAYLELADPRLALDEVTLLWVSRGSDVRLDPVLCPKAGLRWVPVSPSAAVCGPAVTTLPVTAVR